MGEGEVVPAGGVLEGDAILLSEDAGLKPRGKKLKVTYCRCISALDCWTVHKCTNASNAGAFMNVFVCVT